jgi:hypothetical protein
MLSVDRPDFDAYNPVIPHGIAPLMKRHYPWLWFDADGTLFDFARAEGIALEQTLAFSGIPFKDEVLGVYRVINQGMWQAVERHEITPDALQVAGLNCCCRSSEGRVLQRRWAPPTSPTWLNAVI